MGPWAATSFFLPSFVFLCSRDQSTYPAFLKGHLQYPNGFKPLLYFLNGKTLNCNVLQKYSGSSLTVTFVIRRPWDSGCHGQIPSNTSCSNLETMPAVSRTWFHIVPVTPLNRDPLHKGYTVIPRVT